MTAAETKSAAWNPSKKAVSWPHYAAVGARFDALGQLRVVSAATLGQCFDPLDDGECFG